MAMTVSVSQLNKYLKAIMDSEEMLQQIFVRGEISNFTRHFKTGHLYFTLKENNCSIRCVMFAGDAARLKFEPCDGISAIVYGRIAVFERDANCQLYAKNITPDGEGAARQALQALYEKLSAEGLFELQKKLPVPQYPKTIAVLSSASGAAVRDIYSVWKRRWPLCELKMIPVPVQGDTASAFIADALSGLDETVADCAILARGGGSVEDLWVFNDEKLVRAVANCKLPVVSAVGHETDYTLCDLAASRRAATPTAAAELSMPSQDEVTTQINTIQRTNLAAVNRIAAGFNDRYENCSAEKLLQRITLLHGGYSERLISAKRLVDGSLERLVGEKSAAAASLTAELNALSPTATLLRGFCVARSDGAVIDSVKKLPKGREFELVVKDGSRKCKVTEGENDAVT